MARHDEGSYAERIAEYLESGEEMQRRLAGLPSSYGNWFLMATYFGRPTRQVLLTDRNVYVFKLEGHERRVAGTPSQLLGKYPRGSVEVRYQYVPPTLIVGEHRITPTRNTVKWAKPIAGEAGAPSETSATT